MCGHIVRSVGGRCGHIVRSVGGRCGHIEWWGEVWSLRGGEGGVVIEGWGGR